MKRTLLLFVLVGSIVGAGIGGGYALALGWLQRRQSAPVPVPTRPTPVLVEAEE